MQNRFSPAESTNFEVVQQPADFVDIDRVLAAVRRQWLVALLVAILFLAFGGLYLLTTVPRYTASVSVLMDTANQRLADQLTPVGGGVDDETSVLSQVEILRSDSIASAVVEKLNLTADPEFTAPRRSLLSTAVNAITNLGNLSKFFASGDEEVVDPTDLQLVAQRTLTSGLAVSRVGKTFVLKISYTSYSAGLSARIAQAFGEAYLNDQLDSKFESTRRASTWLQDRIAELRERSIQSDLAVQKFRSDNGLLTTGGELVSDQQLQQLNAQLIVAQGATADAEAKFDSVQAMIQSGDVDGMFADALANPIISDMRAKYVDAARREADISQRLGENHEQAVRLRKEMTDYKRLMFEELSRIANSLQTTLQIAQARQKGLEQQVATASGVTATANDSQVQLRELEREAETYRGLYQTFLQRYQEAAQQQSFPVTDARIISKATIPVRPSAPNVQLTLALAGIMGVLAGGVVGGIREFRDRYFRTGDQVRLELGQEFLGLIPRMRDAAISRRKVQTAKTAPSSLCKSRTLTNAVIDDPHSLFAETLRSVKIALDMNVPKKGAKVIGVVSTKQEEGKTIIAINLAELLAKQGARTLLVDGDLRNPSATRLLTSGVDLGLSDYFRGDIKLEEVVRINETTGLRFLPARTKGQDDFSTDQLASPAMDRLLLEAASYDYLVFDLPPIGPVVDARAVASRLDTFLLVIEWGKTPKRLVRQIMQREWMIAEKLFGVVFNKVDLKRMKLYQPESSSGDYYGARYGYHGPST